ncbi:MAG: helicase [Dethiobacter sp.]|nr:MAG: helicase [Dethiobacter sp.]
MFNLSLQSISRECNNDTYLKGLKYFQNGAVIQLHFFKEDLVFEAVVKGTRLYHVNIEFDSNGTLLTAECDCPAFENYSGYCKHIVAVLTSIVLKKKFKNTPAIEQKSIKDILDYFQKENNLTGKQELKLEVTLKYNLNYYGQEPYRRLSLKVGPDRTYIVKNISQFIEAKEEERSHYFGKKFTFDPCHHTFSPLDQPVLDLLTEIYALDTLREGSFFSGSRQLNGKEVALPNFFFKRFLNVLKGRKFSAIILNNEYTDMEIQEEDLALNFSLTKKKEGFLLELKEKDPIIPLTTEGEYFFYRNKIYNISGTQNYSFLPFYRNFLRNKTLSIFIEKEYKERFASELLPRLEEAGRLNIDTELKASFYREPLQAEIYLDNEEEAISARLRFNYGNRSINPFSSESQTASSGKGILIREEKKEKQIKTLFQESEFKIMGEAMYLEDEEKILRFVYNILPELQKHATIYYSENFKKVKVRTAPRFNGRVDLNSGLNMLEFSLELEGTSKEELFNIWKSIKEKRKYHRLKDGSFLPLESEELQAIARLLDSLELKKNDLQKGTATLPKAHAVYLEQFLQENKLESLQQSEEFKTLVNNLRQPGEMNFELPSSLQNVLRDYQKFGFKWLKTLSYYGFGGILADDMGLGKTLQTIAFILSERQENPQPVLVIAPTSLIFNWEAEIHKFTPELKVLVVSGTKKERDELLSRAGKYDVIITSYPLLRRDIIALERLQFSYCILDEAQHIKNPNSHSALAARKIPAANFFALTGTPMENSLTELWSIFHCILPGYLYSHKNFVQKFTPATKKHHEDQDHAMKEITRKVRPFILRRLKKDVLKELPPKIENKMVSELTKEQKKIYRAYLESLRSEARAEIKLYGFEKNRLKILAGLTRLRQICCHPALFIENFKGESGKLIQLREVLQEAVSGGHRILLFSQFTGMLQLIKKMIEKDGYSYFYLDGSVKSGERLQMVKDFNSGQGNIFLISLKAGGTGLNLTGADTVILYDLWWNPAVEDQAAGRAHRIGQQNMVQVIKLLAKGTIEEKIYELQQKKKELIDRVIQSGETLLSAMSAEDIKELLEI